MVKTKTFLRAMEITVDKAKAGIREIGIDSEVAEKEIGNMFDTQTRSMLSPENEKLFAVTHTFVTKSKEERDKFVKMLDLLMGKQETAYVKFGGDTNVVK